MEEKELVTLIQTGLKDLADRIDSRFDQIDERLSQHDSRFAEIDGRFDQIDGRFAEIDGRFTQIDGRFAEIDGRFTQIDGRFDRLDSEVRQAHIQIEGLRGDILQVVEGVANVDEKLERHIIESDRQFDEVRSTIHLSYLPLDQRVGKLELDSEVVNARLNTLESDHH